MRSLCRTDIITHPITIDRAAQLCYNRRYSPGSAAYAPRGGVGHADRSCSSACRAIAGGGIVWTARGTGQAATRPRTHVPVLSAHSPCTPKKGSKMKLTCLQEFLKKGLSIANHAVASKSTLPVLSNVLLATDDGRLKIAATNLEIGLNCWIGAKIETEGAITVPA